MNDIQEKQLRLQLASLVLEPGHGSRRRRHLVVIIQGHKNRQEQKTAISLETSPNTKHQQYGTCRSFSGHENSPSVGQHERSLASSAAEDELASSFWGRASSTSTVISIWNTPKLQWTRRRTTLNLYGKTLSPLPPPFPQRKTGPGEISTRKSTRSSSPHSTKCSSTTHRASDSKGLTSRKCIGHMLK